jgi:anthranilate/para-aminobenzoate synthase component I
VADSIPENEWNECLQKAHVFLDAIEMIKWF